MEEIETIGTRIAYQNKWMTLREDEIRRPSGARGIYGVVQKPDFVVVIPFDGERLYLVEQFRYPIKKRSIEFPQGSWEGNPDANPEKLARGELKEETGFTTEDLRYVTSQYVANGYSNQRYHIFVATKLSQSNTSLDPEEEGLVTQSLDVGEFEYKVRQGEIEDATTTTAYFLARFFGKL